MEKSQSPPPMSAKGRWASESRYVGLINNLKSAPPDRIIFLSDEKNFVVDPVYNAQNDRWTGFNEGGCGDGGTPVDKFMPRSKLPAIAIFLGAMAMASHQLGSNLALGWMLKISLRL